jgi:hypothetical protein
MKCKNCDNEVVGRGSYCGPSCKTLYNRNKKRNTVTIESVTPAVTAVTTTAVTPAFVTAPGEVYGRQAVSFEGNQYETRPIPLNPDDHPHTGGRGKYTRHDGTIYQFDCNGSAFEVINGKAYQIINEVKACYV